MRLNELSPAPGSRRKRKRVGRGPGSGHGRTATRGLKGQKARRQVAPRFEGGQMPLHRRLPKVGFRPRNRVPNQVVNLGSLKSFSAGSVVDPEALGRKGLIRHAEGPVKILAMGLLDVALTVKATAVSAEARKKIEAAGGTVEIL